MRGATMVASMATNRSRSLYTLKHHLADVELPASCAQLAGGVDPFEHPRHELVVRDLGLSSRTCLRGLRADARGAAPDPRSAA